jgi:hypothetical protein
MIKTITHHDLVSKLYQDNSSIDLRDVNSQLAICQSLEDTYYQFKEVKDQLNKMTLQSSNDWTINVLRYAQLKSL